MGKCCSKQNYIHIKQQVSDNCFLKNEIDIILMKLKQQKKFYQFLDFINCKEKYVIISAFNKSSKSKLLLKINDESQINSSANLLHGIKQQNNCPLSQVFDNFAATNCYQLLNKKKKYGCLEFNDNKSFRNIWIQEIDLETIQHKESLFTEKTNFKDLQNLIGYHNLIQYLFINLSESSDISKEVYEQINIYLKRCVNTKFLNIDLKKSIHTETILQSIQRMLPQLYNLNKFKLSLIYHNKDATFISIAQALFKNEFIENVTLNLKNFKLPYKICKQAFQKNLICLSLKQLELSLEYSYIQYKSLSDAIFQFIANQKNIRSLSIKIKQNVLLEQKNPNIIKLHLDRLLLLEKLTLNFNEPIQQNQYNCFHEFNIEIKLAGYLQEISIQLFQINLSNNSLGTLFYQISQQKLLKKFSYNSLNNSKNSFEQFHELLTCVTECQNLTYLEIQYKLPNIQEDQILLVAQQLSNIINLEYLIIDFDKYFQQEEITVFKQTISNISKLKKLVELNLGIFFLFSTEDQLIQALYSLQNLKLLKSLSINFILEQELCVNDLYIAGVSQWLHLEKLNICLKEQKQIKKEYTKLLFDQLPGDCLALQNLTLNISSELFEEEQCQILGHEISKCVNLQQLKIYGAFDSYMSNLFLSELVTFQNLQSLDLLFRMEVQRIDQAIDIGKHLVRFQNLKYLTLEFFNNRMSAQFASKLGNYISKCSHLIIFSFPQKQILQHLNIIQILRKQIFKAKRLTIINCFYLNKGFFE
ncbi:hypothetical protein ABPG72_020435 [Tetrahymena utriculariae]